MPNTRSETILGIQAAMGLELVRVDQITAKVLLLLSSDLPPDKKATLLEKLDSLLSKRGLLESGILVDENDPLSIQSYFDESYGLGIRTDQKVQ